MISNPTRHPLYRVWWNMRQRCHNENHPAYVDYGGRGIRVCERWNSFESFVTDVGPRPAGLFLDRRDNDGNYEPSNCRWITRREQNINQRRSIYVSIGSDILPLKDACRRLGVKYFSVLSRIHKLGWDKADAIREPIGNGRRIRQCQ